MTGRLPTRFVPFPPRLGTYDIVMAAHLPVCEGQAPAALFMVRDPFRLPGREFGVCEGVISEGGWYGIKGLYSMDHATALVLFAERIDKERVT